MKRLLVGSLLVALVLGGCYWTSNTGQGGVQLQLPGMAPKGPYDRYARVWLVANNAIYPLGDGVDYVQKPIPSYDVVTVALEGIPVGPVYRICLAIVEEQPGGFYRTQYWAESAPFELFPGARAAVVFTDSELYDSAGNVFHPVVDYMDADTMMGRSLLNVEVNVDSIYAAEAGVLHHVESFDFATYTENLTLHSLPAPGGDRINSVSLALGEWAGPQVGVNTDRGIYPYNWEDFGVAITKNLGSVSVLDSQSAVTFGEDVVLYFRRPGGWGGTYAQFNSQYTDWIWANHDAGTVWDLTVQQNGNGGAFFATSEGAFFVNGAYLNELSGGEVTPNLADFRQTIRAPRRILCLAYGSPGGDALYMGTEDGLYYAWTPTETSIIDTPQLVAGTEGYRIRRVAMVGGSGTGAALSDAYVFIFAGNTVVKTFPLAAGLPGRVTDLAWYGSYLLVSGSEGLVYYDY